MSLRPAPQGSGQPVVDIPMWAREDLCWVVPARVILNRSKSDVVTNWLRMTCTIARVHVTNGSQYSDRTPRRPRRAAAHAHVTTYMYVSRDARHRVHVVMSTAPAISYSWLSTGVLSEGGPGPERRRPRRRRSAGAPATTTSTDSTERLSIGTNQN